MWKFVTLLMGCALLALTTPSRASTVTETFISAASDYTAQGSSGVVGTGTNTGFGHLTNELILSGDNVRQTFSTGFGSVTGVTFDLPYINAAYVVGMPFNFLVNGTVVGSFTVTPLIQGASETGQTETASLTFAPITTLDGNYTLEVLLTATQPGGDGGMFFIIPGGSSVITGTPLTATPLPASVLLFGSVFGMGGLLYWRRKSRFRKSAISVLG
jgi:hypothetical protein